MAFAIYAPQACDPGGGTLIEVQYPWSSATPLSCQLQVAGLSVPCYGATPGQGDALQPRGPHLRVVTPPLPDGTDADAQLVFTDANGAQVVSLPIRVAPPFYPTSTYALRVLCPTVWAVGPRDLGEEAPL